jgi:hypothetical protein
MISPPCRLLPASSSRGPHGVYWFFFVCHTTACISTFISKQRWAICLLTGDSEWCAEPNSCSTNVRPTRHLLLHAIRTHEAPISQEKESCKRVEWNVVSWALWVVVGRSELCSGGMEASAAESGGQAGCGSGEHLSCRQYSI